MKSEDTMGNQFSDRNANIINNIAGKALTSNGRLVDKIDLFIESVLSRRGEGLLIARCGLASCFNFGCKLAV
eukprot:6480567-Amphidinium_carterae.1